MTREKRLGRGLEALLGRPPSDLAHAAPGSPAAVLHEAAPPATVPVHAIDPNPFQPRREFDDAQIAELSESLRQHGLLQPILVRPFEGRYQLVSGERRLRSAIQLGWREIPAQVRDVDDRRLCEMAMVENLHRRDLNPMEKAASFHAYLQRYGCTQEELAGRLGMDRSTIANLIRLLELPEAVQQAVRSGAISQGHARALLPLGDEDEQIAACRRIEQEAWSVRATEQWVRELLVRESLGQDVHSSRARDASAREPSPQVAELQQQLRAVLGAMVDLRQGARGAGRIVIHFRSRDDFERLFQLLLQRPAAGLRNAG